VSIVATLAPTGSVVGERELDHSGCPSLGRRVGPRQLLDGLIHARHKEVCESLERERELGDDVGVGRDLFPRFGRHGDELIEACVDVVPELQSVDVIVQFLEAVIEVSDQRARGSEGGALRAGTTLWRARGTRIGVGHDLGVCHDGVVRLPPTRVGSCTSTPR
jgi:hypothetical protein